MKVRNSEGFHVLVPRRVRRLGGGQSQHAHGIEQVTDLAHQEEASAFVVIQSLAEIGMKVAGILRVAQAE